MPRRPPEINAGSMADIAFLLLIFFLVATTMGSDRGLRRVLPPVSDADSKPMEVDRRNVLEVFIDARGGVEIGGKKVDISDIPERIEEFILNPSDDPAFSQKSVESIDPLGDYPVSKGIVWLHSDPKSTYGQYIEVQDGLSLAFAAMREQVAQKYFGGRNFNALSESQKDAVRHAVPMRLSEARAGRSNR